MVFIWIVIVVATVVLHAEVPATEHALRAWCAGRLAPHQVPKRVELRAAPLPRTASGKLLRRELR